MNTILEGLFILFGVPVVILIIGLCWGLVFVGAWELYSKIEKWFEGRKKPEAKPFIPTPEQEKELCPRYFNDAVKSEPTKKEQKTLTDIEKELKTLNESYFDDSYIVDTTNKEEQYTCPLCNHADNWALFFTLEECPKCGSGASLAILQWQLYTKHIRKILRWLSSRAGNQLDIFTGEAQAQEVLESQHTASQPEPSPTPTDSPSVVGQNKAPLATPTVPSEELGSPAYPTSTPEPSLIVTTQTLFEKYHSLLTANYQMNPVVETRRLGDAGFTAVEFEGVPDCLPCMPSIHYKYDHARHQKIKTRTRSAKSLSQTLKKQ